MNNLIWIALLLCPLMMIPMFMMMRGNHGNTQQQPNNLTQEVEELKKQNELMVQEINQLKGQN